MTNGVHTRSSSLSSKILVFFSLLFRTRRVVCACQTVCGCNFFLFQNVVNSRPLLPFFKGNEEFFFSFVLGTKTFEANFFGPLDEIGFRRKMPPQKNEEDVLNFVHYKRWS